MDAVLQLKDAGSNKDVNDIDSSNNVLLPLLAPTLLVILKVFGVILAWSCSRERICAITGTGDWARGLAVGGA